MLKWISTDAHQLICIASLEMIFGRDRTDPRCYEGSSPSISTDAARAAFPKKILGY
ncbi:hypothetical protein M758_11G015700 [Ceratodon purpureus]|nr:hypothetical protein M758_11G015700 [Ceratodon purpureus]